MTESEQGSGGTVFEEATVAANAEILSALDSVGGADDSPAHAGPSGERVAAASAPMVGHGVIRLRSQPPPRLDDSASGVSTPGAAAAREPVGHGRVRFVDRSLQLDPSATDAAEADIFSVLSAT